MNDEVATNAYRKELDVAFHDLCATHDNVVQERLEQDDGVSLDTIVDFERSVVIMRRRLLPFVKSQRLREIWMEHDLDHIPEVCGRKVESGETRVGHFGMEEEVGTTTEHASVQNLEMWTAAMVQIYSDLGFAPNVDEGQKQTKIDGKLLEEVNQWREQNI